MAESGQDAIIVDEGLALIEAVAEPDEKALLYDSEAGRAENPASAGVDVVMASERYAQGTASIADLVGRWRFNETSGDRAADVAGDNDGTLIGSADQGVEGKEQTCWEFEGGGNYVDVSGKEYDITDGFTITGWGYLTNDRDPENDSLMNFIETTTDPEAFFLETEGEGDLRVDFGTDDEDGDTYNIKTDWELNLNQWYFFAAVLDVPNDDKRLYIDAELEGQQEVDWEPADQDASFYIGCDSDPDRVSQFWQGRIDDVRIYDAALDQNQIEQIYNTYA